MNIFISYQRSDTLLLGHCLRYAFQAAGHEPFLDTGSIPAGAAFAAQIDGSIAKADLVVVLIGPSFDFHRLTQPNSVIAFEWLRSRFYGCAVLPVLYQVDGLQPESLPAQLRWLPSLNAQFVRDETLSANVDEIVNLVPELARPPRPSARVLWIDDNPKNNVGERRHLRQSGLSFDNVVSTDEAVEQLRTAAYDLVITDLGRSTEDDPREAGSRAVRLVVEAGGPPVVVYANRRAVERRDELMALGAFGSTNSPAALYELIDRALGREPPHPDTALER